MKSKNPPIILLVVIVFGVVLMRLIPHPPNLSPIGALALFSGAYFENRTKFILPIAALFLSDLIIGFHTTMPFVYGSFIVTILLGAYLKQKQSILRIGCLSMISSVLFFFITNFGVWATSSMYASTFSGLMNAYAMGVPFFRNTVAGDLVYSFILFYGLQSCIILKTRIQQLMNVKRLL